jgi:DNA-binding NarL/FixJ family response regulator
MRAADRTLAELAEALSVRPAGLTEREVDVLRLVAIGMSNDDIARRLVVSPRTVHAHVRALFAKLDVSTRAAAAHEASLLNLL